MSRYAASLVIVLAVAAGIGVTAQRGASGPGVQREAEQSPLPPAPSMALHPVTDDDLRGGLKDPTRWLTFSGDYNGQRHSPLTVLTPQTVKGLLPRWIFQTDVPGFPGRGIETTPIVLDGVMYV